MPASKTDTAVRFPENEGQTRRLRNTTQDRKWASRMEDARTSGNERADDASRWSTQQMLGAGVDESGNPNPDPASYNDGAKARKKSAGGEESDLYKAMHQNLE